MHATKHSHKEKKTKPVILIPGLLSFKKKKAGQFCYFGGAKDLLRHLNKRGLDIRLGYCAPFSSNWDRACELYAYIKGGRVDYGEAHSRKNGHRRFGKTYPGVYKRWSARHPVHLVAYSMGIQTARILLHLLTYGSQEERDADPENSSPLFLGEHHGVISLTSLSGTHNGTTFSYYKGRSEKNDIVSLAELFVLLIKPLPIYFNPDLEQFLQLKKMKSENTSQFNQRIIKQIFRSKNHDLAFYDLTLQGAGEINRNFPLPENLFYFSWASRATKPHDSREIEVPVNQVLNPVLSSVSAFIGQYMDPIPGKDQLDSRWLANDGVVNTFSQQGPYLGSNEVIQPFSGRAQSGLWNFMGVLEPFGHWGWQGITRTQETEYAPGLGYIDIMEKILRTTLESYEQAVGES